MYEKYLTNRSIFINWQTLIFILAYFAVRIISFALAPHLILQAALVFIVLLIFGVIFYKNQLWAWQILLAELLLGGAGHFFEFFGLSIRTVLFVVFISLWIIFALATRRSFLWLNFPRGLFLLLSILGIFTIISIFVGLSNQNGLRSIIQDLIPYTFFALIMPAYYFLKEQSNQEYLIRLIISFLISSAIFSLITFILFSGGFEFLQSPYYKWFRDVAMGKITDLGGGFFRIVLPEHLLIAPIMLLTASLLMRPEKHHKLWWLMLIPAALILVLNFSRVYFLALLAGLLILKYKHLWKRWLYIGATVILLSFAIFFSVNFIAGHGQSFGLELLGLRVNSLTRPKIETSSFTRMALLDSIGEMIIASPLIGYGLGSKVIFMDPIKNLLVSTSQFDWGYLELWVELGLFGLFSFISIIIYIFRDLIKKIRAVPDYHDFYVGILAGAVSLAIINITAPALFHVLGVFYLVLVIVLTAKHYSSLEQIITLLYRTFRKVK